MGKHKLKKGLDIIDALLSLGKALHYAAIPEMPLEKNRKNAEAVDVAWMLEADQEFPLMVFEVESRTGNTIANNPTKIYGKTTVKFEKPLFFFHILIDSTSEASKVDVLKTLFGTHNYRIYELAHDGEINALMKDILSQHRRITSKFDLREFYSELNSSHWTGIDQSDILKHIETIGFEKNRGQILPAYAAITADDSSCTKHFIRYLAFRDQQTPSYTEADQYPTYIGGTWHYPLHLAILGHISPDKEATKYLARLINWQEKSYSFTQIGPHFKLSMDYDCFIVGQAGFLWAVMATLFAANSEAVQYISKQCLEIFESIKDKHKIFSFYTALWLLHISTLTPKTTQTYELARDHINSNGGISASVLYYPPGIIYVEQPGNWLREEVDLIDVPEYDQFIMSKEFIKTTTDDILTLTIKVLTDILGPESYSADLVRNMNKEARKHLHELH